MPKPVLDILVRDYGLVPNYSLENKPKNPQHMTDNICKRLFLGLAAAPRPAGGVLGERLCHLCLEPALPDY